MTKKRSSVPARLRSAHPRRADGRFMSQAAARAQITKLARRPGATAPPRATTRTQPTRPVSRPAPRATRTSPAKPTRRPKPKPRPTRKPAPRPKPKPKPARRRPAPKRKPAAKRKPTRRPKPKPKPRKEKRGGADSAASEYAVSASYKKKGSQDVRIQLSIRAPKNQTREQLEAAIEHKLETNQNLPGFDVRMVNWTRGKSGRTHRPADNDTDLHAFRHLIRESDLQDRTSENDDDEQDVDD